MAYVSVGQVENIEDAIAGLHAAYDSMGSICQVLIEAVLVKLDETQKEADTSTKMHDKALETEMDAQRKLEQCREQLLSDRDLLRLTNSSLSVCGASGSYNEDNNYEPPDCSFEEAEVYTAESVVIEAGNAVVVAEGGFEETKEYRMQMGQRSELASQCLNMTTQVAGMVQMECATRLVNSASLLEIGRARLEGAKIALHAYLDAHPSAVEFNSWNKWSPQSNKPITPKELQSRLNLSPEQQRYFLEYLSDRDPVFRTKIADYRRQLDAADGPSEKLTVQLKVRRNLSGYCGEKIVEHGLSPLGYKSDTQARTTFEDGRFTKTDLLIEDLKVPVILGRGKGMSASVGGSIAIEVKCGRASYLYSEKDHMVFQSGGHQEADASMTICSRDIKDLTPEQEKEIREALRNAGSPLLGVLPSKDEIDKACWEMVTGTNMNNGGDYEN